MANSQWRIANLIFFTNILHGALYGHFWIQCLAFSLAITATAHPIAYRAAKTVALLHNVVLLLASNSKAKLIIGGFLFALSMETGIDGYQTLDYLVTSANIHLTLL